MKLVVGLGNPGSEYHTTRHNLGWLVLDASAKQCEAGEWRTESTFESQLVEVRVGAERVLLAKPTTFMNNSGRAVAGIARYYKITPEDVLLVHDELDLPLGTLRLRLGGSAAGHHCVESVTHHMSTDHFWRLRCGIAPENRVEGGEGSRFVLAPFNESERPMVTQVVEQASTIVYEALVSGILTEATLSIPSVGGGE